MQVKLTPQIRGHATNSVQSRLAQKSEEEQLQRINYRELRLAEHQRSRSDTVAVVPSMLIPIFCSSLNTCGIKESIDQKDSQDGDNLKSSLPSDKLVIRQKYPGACVNGCDQAKAISMSWK